MKTKRRRKATLTIPAGTSLLVKPVDQLYYREHVTREEIEIAEAKVFGGSDPGYITFQHRGYWVMVLRVKVQWRRTAKANSRARYVGVVARVE